MPSKFQGLPSYVVSGLTKCPGPDSPSFGGDNSDTMAKSLEFDDRNLSLPEKKKIKNNFCYIS